MQNFVTLLHLSFLALALLGILLADHSAFKWLRGHEDPKHREKIFRSHWIVSAGLAGLVLTGLYLFWPLREYLLLQPLFWLKMFFVATLLINSFFIEQLMHLAAEQSFASLKVRQKIALFISGAVSSFSWLGTATAAILLFRWPFV